MKVDKVKKKNLDKVILDLCSGSGEWSRPYLENGYRVLRFDTEYTGHDIRLLKLAGIPDKIYGILAAPPCQHLAVSGAKYWESKGDAALIESLSIVDACIRLVKLTNPVFWVLENPVGRLKHYLGNPIMYFHPYEFGDPYTKKTCLWGEFNEPVKTPVKPERVCKQGSWIMKLGGSSQKTKFLRSMTPAGFARAFYEANK